MNALILNNIAGRLDRLASIIDRARVAHVDALFVLGNLVAAPTAAINAATASRAETIELQSYAQTLDLLGSLARPVYVIPGAHDRSLALLSQAVQAYSGPAQIHLVHRISAALGTRDIVAGFGGQLTAGTERSAASVQFPAWEARVAFEHLAAYDRLFQKAQQRILLFATPPRGQQIDQQNDTHVGSGLLNSLIRRYQPDLVCSGGPTQGRGVETIDGTRIVNPGSAADGSYALVDLERHDIRLEQLPESVALESVRFRSIVTALDGSAESWRALELAAGLAHSMSATLTLVSAFDPTQRSLGAPYLDDKIAERIAAAEALLAKANIFLAGVAVHHEVLEGPLSSAILRAAEAHRADLIVMGERRSGAVRTLLGGVSQRILSQAPCPVLLTHERPEHAALASRSILDVVTDAYDNVHV